MKKLETLTYSRVAHKAKDSADGFLYIHTWATGYEQLIFPTHEAANKYKEMIENPDKLEKYLKSPA